MQNSSITLRNITLNDTKNIIQWRNNPIVLKNFIDQTPLTEKIHMEWYNTKIKQGLVYQKIIYSKELKKDIGSVFLRNISKTHKKGEFGIFIGENDARGKGYGQLATQQFIINIFKTLKLHKIYLRVLAKNVLAIESYKKAGFNIVGIFQDDVYINSQFFDIIFMEILNG